MKNLVNTIGIKTNQVLSIEEIGDQTGFFIFYNSDFYCIQIHDEEVACDGLLFNNINNIISNLNYFSLAPAVRFLDEGFLSSAARARLFSSATSTHFLAERFFSS